MSDLGHGKDLKFNKTIDPSTPMEYSGDPVLTPGSNQLATMKSIIPALEAVTDFVDFTTAEPVSPNKGDRNINTVTGVSSITTQLVTANYIYEWNGVDYTETVPSPGDIVFVINLADNYKYTGTAWIVDSESFPQAQVYYVSPQKGNDSNSGTSRSDPVATIDKANDLAIAQTPAADNPFKLQLIGGDIHDLTEDVILGSYVYVVGEASTLTSTTSGKSLVLSANSGCTIGNVLRGINGYTIQKIDSGNSFLTILDDVDTGDFGFINQDAGNLFVTMNNLTATAATNAISIQIVGGNMFLNGKRLDNTHASGKTIAVSGSGRIYATLESANGTNEWLNLTDSAHAYIKTKETTGGTSFAGGTTYDIESGSARVRSSGIALKLTSDYNVIGASHGLGGINGFVVKYRTSTSVTITAKSIQANGKLYILSADTEYPMESLASGYGHHYIYIDDAESTEPTAAFIDDTTEPAWSDSKQGWYDGNNRCIGSVISPSGASIIAPFSTLVVSDKTIKYNYRSRTNMLQIASNMIPTGSWQTPDDNDGSAVTPVNAIALSMTIAFGDAGAACNGYAASSEYALLEAAVGNAVFWSSGYDTLGLIAEIILGTSRNIKIAGASGDDNVLTAYSTGFTISR